MNWTKSMRRQGRILHSSFWCTLHFDWMALWLKAASTRAPPILNYREDLSVEDGLATKGSRLLIPSTLWRKALEQIHEGHQGIEKCMLKARESVYWPGISDDIHEAVEKCGICQSTSRAAKPVGNISEVPPMHGIPWELTCSTGTEWTFLWLVITLQNSWSWGKFQILPHMQW